MLRLRSETPPPQLTVHADHADHTPTTQSTGQICMCTAKGEGVANRSLDSWRYAPCYESHPNAESLGACVLHVASSTDATQPGVPLKTAFVRVFAPESHVAATVQAGAC